MNYKNESSDVFRSFLVRDANYTDGIELPCLKTSRQLPNKLIPFSYAISSADTDQWVVFYESDSKFERVWNNPKRYLPILKKFRGVISPDFSLYRDMPLCMQQWSAYKGRALAHWWQSNGIEVIPNVRFADERSYSFCFDGIEPYSIVAVGTHGCIKNKANRAYFQRGLSEMICRLHPHTIIVYGSTPDSLFLRYKEQGINILQFDSRFAQTHKAVKC